MALFGRKKDEDYEDEDDLDLAEEREERKLTRKFRDLKSENRKKRKEPPKPWGKKERYIVLTVLLLTALTSGILAVSARDFKLPGFPRISFGSINFENPFREQIVTIGGRGESVAEIEKRDAAIVAFNEKTRNLSGVYSLYVVRPKTGTSYGVNDEDVMQAASLIKLPVFIALYQEVEKGNIDLETKYSLKNSDKRAGSGSLAGKPAGTVLTYRDLVRYMGKESDNTAFNILRNVLGDAKIAQVITAIGMTKTSLEENETSPEDIGLLFQKLWNKELTNEGDRDEILGYLTDTIYEDWLVKGIPDEVRVAHKYGREIHVVNDGGIVFAKDPFVIVIMTQGIIEKEADEGFPDLAKTIYEIETKN